MEIESSGEGRQRTDTAAIRADYDIPDLQARCLRRTSRRHVIDDNPPILREAQSFGQVVVDRLSARLDLDAMHVPILTQALIDELHDSCRDGKPESFASTQIGRHTSE